MMIEKPSYTEEEFVQLSGLQHLVFCERQCALIQIEQVWSDNPLTLEGSYLHHHTDEEAPRREVRGDVVICRALPLRSFSLGLSGRADVVEFHRVPERRAGEHPEKAPQGARLQGLPGLWTPFPVEYKRGKPKPELCDEVQLCAQALCLEEMLGVPVRTGALFYGKIQRRHNLEFGDMLRELTRSAAKSLHELLERGITPPARKEPKCRGCSLLEICLPQAQRGSRSAKKYISLAIGRLSREEGDGLE
ncbi:MAG: CRISPR-associated protein Cas4 [candidate division WOR-3 bacterium]